ncbi:hypothetical protein [Engelhardtia mirabilis]|uniref:Uncharacterized protein n=1 Tax=Engelhardtia mirabilis TaxID=2528011 RepID=A0A518BIX2_9BACT|nr:hypothetical protein Pla133_20070 [Planctomycetes bacterium Pla133]QDV01258.1 hypothetical protein Pla86_20070 [Planctomycetes bacterium Pla86]
MSARKHRRPLYPAACASGALGFAVGTATENPGAGLVVAFLAALFGLYVSGVLRLFPVHPAAFPLLGAMLGPLPLSFIGRRTGEAGNMIMVGLILGLALGLLEWGVEAGRGYKGAAPSEQAPADESADA